MTDKIPHMTKSWYYVAVVKLLIDRIYDRIQVIRNSNRKEAIAVYDDPEGLPDPSKLKIVWEGTDISAPLLDIFDGENFEKTYIIEKNKMLKILDGVDNE